MCPVLKKKNKNMIEQTKHVYFIINGNDVRIENIIKQQNHQEIKGKVFYLFSCILKLPVFYKFHKDMQTYEHNFNYLCLMSLIGPNPRIENRLKKYILNPLKCFQIKKVLSGVRHLDIYFLLLVAVWCKPRASCYLHRTRIQVHLRKIR